MRYVKHILIPNEKVLYDGHVHPSVLIPGFLWLGFAVLILYEASNTGGGHSFLLRLLYPVADALPPMEWLYNLLSSWQHLTPNIALEIKILALGMAIYGLYRFITQLLVISSTELVITNFRVIAKTGIATILTIEMDKRRIAGVVVQQTIAGRIMGYGSVLIQGFTNSIGNLPVLVKPHLVERYLATY